MKRFRSGALPKIWRGMTSVRLAVTLMSGIIGLCVLATVIAQRPISPRPLNQLYSPELLYRLERAGLTDIFHSGWFFSVFSLLALNLFCLSVDRLAAGWRALRHPPEPFSASILTSKKKDKSLITDLRLKTDRDAFRILVQNWFKRAQVIRDDTRKGELQLVAQAGRYSALLRGTFYLALVLIILGGGIGALLGFEGQVTIDEGARVGYLEIHRGNKPWPILKAQGRVMPGFHSPGFEVELTRFDSQASQAWLTFFEDHKQVASSQLKVNEPATFRGIRFLQSESSSTGRWVARLSVEDRDGSFQRTFYAAQGQSYPFEGFSVKVLEIQPKLENTGSTLQLEYTEDKKPAEKFWIFENFPKYDAVHRKNSRYHFTIDFAKEGYSATLLVSRDPGAPWVWAGFAVLLLSLAGLSLASHDRYFFIWTPNRIGIIGASDRPSAFLPRFVRVSDSFKAKTAKLEKAAMAPVESAPDESEPPVEQEETTT